MGEPRPARILTEPPYRDAIRSVYIKGAYVVGLLELTGRNMPYDNRTSTNHRPVTNPDSRHQSGTRTNENLLPDLHPTGYLRVSTHSPIRANTRVVGRRA